MILRFVRAICQKFGYHLTPINFHSPIPDIRTLKSDIWSKKSDLLGVDINGKKQLEMLSLFTSKYKNEYDLFPKNKTTISNQYYLNNGFFMGVDGEILYCMIRHFKPKKIIEIGSGYSTCLFAEALLKNKDEVDEYDCEFVVIDPFPNEVVKKGFNGLSKLISKPVQDIPLSEFTKLTDNDFLFIDSTHVLKIGSDVQYEYLEIIPSLNKGVIIHAHDIFIPSELPRNYVLQRGFYWNEQYLLQAFLMFNSSFEVMWAASYMHLNHPEKLEESFGSYDNVKTWPKSFWFRRRKGRNNCNGLE